MHGVYKILGISEELWKQLDEDYLEIVRGFLAGDLAKGLSEEEQKSLQLAIEGKDDVQKALGEWARANPEKGVKVGEKFKDSWLSSTTKFFEALMKDATPQQKSAVISLMQKKEQNG
jgi:hypothetical protein